MKTGTLDHRRRGRLFYCLVSLVLALGISRQAAAANTTTVQDVIYRADGTPAAGTLVISWPAFTTADNSAVAAGSLSVAIAAQGAISVTLVPNAGGTPDGTYYKVIYKLDDGSTSEEYWSVPATTMTTISNVRSRIVPSGLAMQVASRQYVDNAIAAALSGGGHTPFLNIVTSFNGRTGAIVPAANDYAYSQLGGVPSSFNAGQLQGYNLDAPSAAGQQPTFNGLKFVEQAKQRADFRDFGVHGDVLTDDTNAANRAIAALANNGGSLQLPGSANFFWMRLTSPLNLSNTGNFKIEGGLDSTGFLYCGNGSGPVVNANNTFNLGLQDLGIYGHWGANCTPTYATAGIAWDKTGNSGWNATRLMVNHVTITGAPQGDIGTPNFTCVDISPTSQVNVEDGKFYNISCIPGGIGFHIGPSANPKNEIFFNNNVTFGQYGYKFEGGGYHIKYGEVGNLAQSALWFSGANDPVSVDGLLSEANTQFLRLGPGFGHMPITLSHINNGWDDKATAPCFWDIGGAQYFLAFSNTWSDTSFATPHAVCGNSGSSGMFINNSFAWKAGGVNSGLYAMLPPPATIQQLLGPSYGFYHGGNIVLGSVNPATDNGLSFIQSTGGTRLGLRMLENPNPRSDGAIPAANDDPYLGEGVLEVAGPGAPTLLPGCTVTGGDTSQGYLFWMFAKDANGRRTTQTHTFCSGPATPDSNHQMTFQWVGTPGSQSYDTMFLVNSQSCFIGNTTATSITVSAMPTCDNSYPHPTQNEAEYLNLRGKGVYGYGPSSATVPTWSIDTAAGAASFTGGVFAPNVAQLCTASNAQPCIDAVSAGGGTVYLGPGTYTGAITLPDNGKCVNLVGSGIDVTFMTVSASVAAVISKANGSLPLGCRISDLTIDGNLQATYGIQALKGKGWVIERVKVKRVLADTGEAIQLGESSGSSAEFYEARLRAITVAFESSDYSSSHRPLNGLHFLATATDNQVSDVTAWNMSNAGIVDDAGDNQYNKVHVYGFPLLTYYPNYAMEVLGNAHITQLTADGVSTGGVHVRGNGNSVTNSTFQWPSGGQVSGAFPILADGGTDYNVYSDNVVRNGSGLTISGLAAVFAQIGTSYLPGTNTEISRNTNWGDGADGVFANFPVAGYYSFGQGSPRGAFTFISPYTTSSTIAARLKASQTADLFDCLSADASTKLCSIDNAGNAQFTSINASALPAPTSSTLGGIESSSSVSHQWVAYIDTSGVEHQSQPGFSDLSGSASCSQLPALTGDATTSAGNCATTVAKVNGGSIPASANFVGTNPSGQLISQAAAVRVAATSLTGQTASISNTTLYTPSSAGTYRVSLAMWTMAMGSSGTVSFSLSASTGSGAESFGSSSLDLTKINSGGQVSGQWNIHVGASQAISYNTTLTCSSCGSPQYGIDVVVERLQ